MRFNHILILCEDSDLALKVGKDLWERNKSWCVVSVNKCQDEEFKRVLKKYKTISLNDTECWKDRPVNEFIRYCAKWGVLPIFITRKDKIDTSFAHVMYSNIEEVFLDSLDYIHDPEDTAIYKEFLNIVAHYLW